MIKKGFSRIHARFYGIAARVRGEIYYLLIRSRMLRSHADKIDLCGGPNHIDGYFNVDASVHADLMIDLERRLLPFQDESARVVVCISAINYFTRKRGAEIVRDVYRVLKPNGVARFASQDLRSIAERYVRGDVDFFFQKLPNGNERFTGATMADKINSWFSGYPSSGKPCRYFYDFETLALIFKDAGFLKIEQKRYGESALAEIKDIDNRPDQMFFLEAVK